MAQEDFSVQIAEFKRDQAVKTEREHSLHQRYRYISNAWYEFQRVVVEKGFEEAKRSAKYTRLKIWIDSMSDALPCYRANPLLWHEYTSKHRATRTLSIRETLNALKVNNG